MKIYLTISLFILLPIVTGCISISETKLRIPTLRYPVSMTPAIVDFSGNNYTPQADEKVSHFQREWDHWATLWGFLPVTSDADLTQILQEEIEKADGNGIVNLTIQAKGSLVTWFVSHLLIFPGKVTVVVEGDIVQSPSARLK